MKETCQLAVGVCCCLQTCHLFEDMVVTGLLPG